MDYEEVANISINNYTLDEDITPSQSRLYITHEIIFTLFSIVGICANSAIIYTIFHFRRMRTAENIFLANWAIADLSSLIVTPSSYRIVSVIDDISISPEFMCVLLELGAILHFTVMLFVMLVSIDWFISTCFQKGSKFFRKYYKFIIGFVWIFSLLICGLLTGCCIQNSSNFVSGFILLICFFTLIIITIICQCSRAIRKCLKKQLDQSTLMLTLTTAYTGCWVFGFIIIMGTLIANLHSMTLIIGECAIFGTSIVNFTLLYRLNNDFQACLLQALKRSNNKYEESICSYKNPVLKNKMDKDSVQILLHDPKEELLSNMD